MSRPEFLPGVPIRPGAPEKEGRALSPREPDSLLAASLVGLVVHITLHDPHRLNRSPSPVQQVSRPGPGSTLAAHLRSTTAEVPTELAKDYIVGEPFRALEKVTILGGAENTLWHRDSADRMYDWLRRVLPADRCVKHVLEGYGHQDLWWGRRSWHEVFPLVRAGLGPTPHMVIIVSRTESARHPYLKRVFACENAHVIVDRRAKERRRRQNPVAAENRRGDRRQRDIANDLRTVGEALTW